MTSKSWEQMAIEVIAHGRPADLAQAAAGWETFRRRLLDLQHHLDRDVRSLTGSWKGLAAEAFQTHMSGILADIDAVLNSMTEGAGVIESLRATSHSLADAQQQMPVPAAAVQELLAARNLQVTYSVGSFSTTVEPDFYGKPPVEAAAALTDFINNQTDEARLVYEALNSTVEGHAQRLPEPPPPIESVNTPTIPPPDLTDPGVDGGHTGAPSTGPGGVASTRTADPSVIGSVTGPYEHVGDLPKSSAEGVGRGAGTGLAGAGPVSSPTVTGSGIPAGGLSPVGTSPMPNSPGGGIASPIPTAITRSSGGGYLGKPVSGTPTSITDRSTRSAPGGRTTPGGRPVAAHAAQPAAVAGRGSAGAQDSDKQHRSTWLLEDDDAWAPRDAPSIDILGATPPDEFIVSDGPGDEDTDSETAADFLLGGRRTSDVDPHTDDQLLVRAPQTSRAKTDGA